jgi:membrane associated rhomboid family serine protease
MEERPMEETSVEEKIVEETPVYGTPVEEKIAEEAPVYGASVETRPTEQKQSNGFAIASLVIGIIALLGSCCYGGLLGILGIIFGIVAIKKSQSQGMSIAGIATSAVALLITIVILAVGIMALRNPEFQNALEDAATATEQSVQ